MPKFLWHVFVKRHQSSAYEEDKERAKAPGSKLAVVQMDFSENYTCVYQDECASAHWHQNQVSLYTVVVWTSAGQKSLVVVSDSRSHEKSTVAIYLTKVLDMIKKEYPDTNEIIFWTDGPSSQFKNKYIFALLVKMQFKYEISMKWNYSAAGHGKGPVDAVGGTSKRVVNRLVMTRKWIVNSAKAFAEALDHAKTSISIILVPENEIESLTQELETDKLFEIVSDLTIPGTINTHYFEPVTPLNGSIIRKFYSRSMDLYRNKLFDMDFLYNSEVNSQAVDHGDSVSQPQNIITVMAEVHASFNDSPAKPAAPQKPSLTQKTRERRERGKGPRKSKKRDPKPKDQSHCTYCNFVFNDPTDPKLDEGWLMCHNCTSWYHNSCAEMDGLLDDFNFTCKSCFQN
jgi:hypothetical protein